MRTKLVPGAILVIGAIALISSVSMAKSIDIGPEMITMKSASGEKPASFPHRAHQKTIGCMECHHISGQEMNIDKCASCHIEEMENKNLNSIKEAAHARCRDCHKTVSKSGGNAPVKCSGCHPYVKK